MLLLTIFLSFAAFTIAIPTMRYEGRIVGGNDVNRTTAPYQVSIRYSNKHFCGGSILNNRVIATAAHCNQFEIEKVSISYGSINVSTGQVVNVQFSYTHPNYNNITMENDVAVMILKEDIIFSDTARPIPLATQEPIKNTLLFVTGWGVLSQGGQTATILQGAYLMAVTRDSCKEAYYYTPYKITEDMICASIGGSDACQGDSGGPLTIEENGEKHLVGIVSWALGCANPTFPGVYANLVYLKDFFNRFIQD